MKMILTLLSILRGRIVTVGCLKMHGNGSVITISSSANKGFLAIGAKARLSLTADVGGGG